MQMKPIHITINYCIRTKHEYSVSRPWINFRSTSNPRIMYDLIYDLDGQAMDADGLHIWSVLVGLYQLHPWI
jgi:hypothetical protein